MAGVSLAETAYANQVEASVAPLRGLLLGLFFVTVGFSIDVSLLAAQPLRMLGLAGGLVALKAVTLAGLRQAPETVDTDGAQNRCFVCPERRICFVAFGP